MTLFTLLLGACSMAAGPRTAAEAFEIAHIPTLAQAEQLRYSGDRGLDAIVMIQFMLPSWEEAERYLSGFGCTLRPVTKTRDNPFLRPMKGDPPWWVHAAPEGARVCSTEPRPGEPVFRDVRVDPMPGGQVLVQIAATTS